MSKKNVSKTTLTPAPTIEEAVAERYLNIKDAARYSGKSEQYIRALIRNGKLITKHVQVGETQLWRHEIPLSSLESYMTNGSSHGRREDGRNKYTVYLTPAELVLVQSLMADAGLKLPIERAVNNEKAKEYRLRRAAQRKAQLRDDAVAEDGGGAVASARAMLADREYPINEDDLVAEADYDYEEEDEMEMINYDDGGIHE
jgi:hypothetical protein